MFLYPVIEALAGLAPEALPALELPAAEQVTAAATTAVATKEAYDEIMKSVDTEEVVPILPETVSPVYVPPPPGVLSPEVPEWSGPTMVSGSRKSDPSSTDGDGPGSASGGKKVPSRRRAPRPPGRSFRRPKMRRDKPPSKQKGNKGRAKTVRSHLAAPVSISSSTHSSRPRFTMTPAGDEVTVSRLEFVEDFEVPSTHDQEYFSKSYVVTPVNSTLFRWLSGVAARYEAYSFEHLALHYRPSSSTSTPGMVGLAAEYDAQDDAPVNKHDFLNVVPSKRSSVWAPCDMHMSRKGLNMIGPHRYSGEIQTNEVLLSELDSQSHTRFAGKAYVMFDGVPAGTKGEVWVSYTVKLKVPDYTPQVSVPAPYLAVCNGTRSAILTNTASGGPVVVQALRGVTIVADNPTSGIGTGSIQFINPSQHYRVQIFIKATNPAVTIFSNDDGVDWDTTVGVDVLDVSYTSREVYKPEPYATADYGIVTAYVETKHVSEEGPTQANPGYLAVDATNCMVGSLTSWFGITVEQITKAQYDYWAYFRSPNPETKVSQLRADSKSRTTGRLPVQSPLPSPQSAMPPALPSTDVSPVSDGWVQMRPMTAPSASRRG